MDLRTGITANQQVDVSLSTSAGLGPYDAQPFVYLAQLKPAISRDWSSSLWRRIIQREGKVETWHPFADIGAEVKQSREAEGNSSQSSDCSRPGQRGPMVDLQDAKSAKCKVIAALCTQAAVFLAWYQSWRRCGLFQCFSPPLFSW